jgi:hypothetical protein
MSAPNRVLLAATQTFQLANMGFDCLSVEIVHEIFKDGRAFSHFIERWMATKSWKDAETGVDFQLTHIKGCKKHDFEVIQGDETLLYDEKTFTSGGCSFMPSGMIGKGRKFDAAEFQEKVKTMNYVIVDNTEFPKITVKFAIGEDLAKQYPKGCIPFKDREAFFAN